MQTTERRSRGSRSVIKAVVGDAIPRARIVACDGNFEAYLRAITELPVCVHQQRVDQQGSGLRFVEFHGCFKTSSAAPTLRELVAEREKEGDEKQATLLLSVVKPLNPCSDLSSCCPSVTRTTRINITRNSLFKV